MKPWYRKKKVWASILGALAVVLTIFFSPERIEAVERISLAVLEAAIVIGFVVAESSIDKAGVGNGNTKAVETENKRLTEPLRGHCKRALLTRAQKLKESDGEGWAIGELIERVCEVLKG